MESFLRTRVDLQQMYSSSTMALGVGGDAHYFEDLVTPDKVRQYLNSSSESDKLKGMKVLLAQLSKGKDIPEYFPDVVKNVVVKSVEVKKMIYMYMVHYADFDRTCREIALLSINTFHRDMSDPNNPFVRGMALRVLTSIRVDDVIQIQLHAIRSCAVDSSPYVRKCAANAIPKMYYLDPTKLDNLKALLETLLKDNSTMVLGSTLAAFNEVCPTAFELLHAHFRKICYLLADMDEWSQVPILEVLARYVRHHFTDPAPEVAATARLQAKQRSAAAIIVDPSRVVSSPPSAATHPYVKPNKPRVVKKAFYSDDEDQSEEEEEEEEEGVGPVLKPQLGSTYAGDDVDPEVDLDADHRLVLKSSLPLLKSRNAAVVISVAALHYYCGSRSAQVMQQVAKAMVRILRTRREVQFVVLHCVRSMARERPAIFKPFLPDFVVKATDPLFNKLLKVDILTALTSADNVPRVLKEYQLYAADQNETLVAHTIAAVGQVAARADPSLGVADSCLEGIMRVLVRSCSCTSGVGVVVSACAVTIRQLLQQNMHSRSCANIVKQLMKLLISENDGGVSEPSARSSIVWLAGEFHLLLAEATPDILRVLSMGFSEEAVDTRMQILNLAIKLSLLLPDDEKVQLLATYVLEMARYDPDTDVRDRSRLMTALMGLAPSTADADGNDVSTVDEDALAVFSEHAAKIMLAGKLPPVTAMVTASSSYSFIDPDGSSSDYYVGSLSSIVNHNAVAYIHIAPWAEAMVPSLRDGIDGSGTDFLPGHHHHHPTQSSSGTAGSDGNFDARKFYEGEESSRGGSDSDGSDEDSDKSDGSQSSDSSAGSYDTSSDSSSSSGGDDDDDEKEDEEDSSSSCSEDEDSSVDRSVPSPGARKIPSRPTGPGFIQSHSSGSSVSINSSNNNNSNKNRLTEATTASSSMNMTGSRSVMSSAGMKKVVKSSVPVASSSASSSGRAALGSKTGSVAAVGQSFDLLSIEPLHVAPAGSLQIHGSLDDASLDLLNGWSTGYSEPSAMNSMQAVSAMNSMQGNTMNSMQGNTMNSMQGNTMNSMQGNTMNSMQGNVMNSMQGKSSMSGMSSGPGGMMAPSLLPNVAPPHVYHPTSTAGGESPLPINDSMSVPKLVLKPEVGGGLKVSLCFHRSSSLQHYAKASSTTTPAATDVFQAVLTVTNCREYPIRRVRIIVQSMDPSRPSIVLPEIAAIPPASSPSAGDNAATSGMFRSSYAVASAHEVSFPLDLVLPHCSVRQLKVDVRSESGVYVGCLQLEEWDLVRPLPMHVFDFEDRRSRLGGFCENSRSYPLSAITATGAMTTRGGDEGGTGEVERLVQQRVQRALFVSAVQGLNKKELMFAGCIRKGSEVHRLLITVSLNSDNAKVRINCEDPVFCSRLSDVFVTLLKP